MMESKYPGTDEINTSTEPCLPVTTLPEQKIKKPWWPYRPRHWVILGTMTALYIILIIISLSVMMWVQRRYFVVLVANHKVELEEMKYHMTIMRGELEELQKNITEIKNHYYSVISNERSSAASSGHPFDRAAERAGAIALHPSANLAPIMIFCIYSFDCIMRSFTSFI